MIESIRARGHGNVVAGHKTTIEITREESLTPRGDCIVCVGADKGLCDLGEDFKDAARDEKAVIEVTLSVDGLLERIWGRGHPDLSFDDTSDLVIRKSDYVCGRTLMIKADKAAVDLSREMVEKLKDPDQMVEISIKLSTMPP